MLPDAVRTLIVDEQERQHGRFIEGVNLTDYLAKLDTQAEILVDLAPDRCRGFVAFYCNDESTRKAFVTLVAVHPDDRRSGLARGLLAGLFDIFRRRGFRSCALEVAHHNEAARAMWLRLGFHLVERRAGKDLMEVVL